MKSSPAQPKQLKIILGLIPLSRLVWIRDENRILHPKSHHNHFFIFLLAPSSPFSSPLQHHALRRVIPTPISVHFSPQLNSIPYPPLPGSSSFNNGDCNAEN